MARKLNRNLVGVLTLVLMVLLGVTGLALLENLPGQDPKIYEADAKKLEEQGLYEEATQMYARAYKRDPAKNPEYLVMAARTALEDGKVGMARELLRNALIRNAALRSALALGTDLEFEIAQMFPSANQWGRVVERAKKLVEVDEESVVGHQALGTAYVELQSEDSRYAEMGEEELRKALALDPGNPKVVQSLTRQLWARQQERETDGKHGEADALAEERNRIIRAAEKNCSSEPDRAAEMRRLAAIFKIAEGQAEEGVAELKALADQESGNVDAHMLLASLYEGRFGAKVPADLSKAEDVLKEALELDPKKGAVYLELGGVYKRQRSASEDPETDKALAEKEAALYRKGLEMIPRTAHFRELQNNIARTRFFTELVLLELAEAESAADQEAREESLQSAESWLAKMKQETELGSVDVRFLQASIYNARGELVLATKEAEEADRASANRPHAGLQVLLSELYAKQRQWGAAETACRKAIALSPETPALILRLAQVLLEQNKASEALVLLRTDDDSRRSRFLKRSSVAARLRVEALRQLKRYDEALTEGQRLEEGGSIADQLRHAQLLMLNRDYVKAEKELKQLLTATQDNLSVVRSLVKLYQDSQQAAKAVALVDAQLAKKPDDRMLRLMKLDLTEEGTKEEREARAIEIIKEESDPFVRAVSLFDFFVVRERLDEARQYLDEAEKLQPENPAIIDRQFRFALNSKDWDRAAQYAELNGKLNLDGTEGKIALGQIALAKKDYARAIELMKSGLERYPSYSLGWTYLADAYVQAGRPADARTVLQEALKRDPTNGYANKRLAEMEIKAGNEGAARKHLESAARDLPGDAWVSQQLQIIKEKENPLEGIATREKIRRESPKNLQNLVLLARLYALPQVAEYDKAAEAYHQALEVSEYNIELANEVARFFGRQDVNRPSEGDALLAGLLSKAEDKSTKAQIALYMGQFYEAQKQLATADRHFRLAVSQDSSSKVLVAAGEYYARSNRYRDALEYYDRALKQVSGQPAEAESIHARVIALLLAIGDLDRARTEIDRFIEAYPRNPQGMIYEGAYHRIAGDVHAARRAFDAHLEKNPDNAVALWQRGQLFMLMGQWRKAIDDLEKSKTFNPTGFNFQHRISLAGAYLETGQTEAAIAELRLILDEHPDEQPVAEALIDAYQSAGPSRYQDAENLIHVYARRFPRDFKWPMLLGRLAERSQDLEKAIQAYESAAELSRFRREPVEALFKVCRIANKPQVIIDYAAEKLSTRLLESMPAALAATAWAYTQVGEEEKAIQAYDEALASTGRDFALYTRIVAEMKDVFGKEAALARAQKRAEASPDEIDRQKVLVHLLQMNERTEEAYQVCERIQKLAVRDDDTLFALLGQGMLLEQMGRNEEARDRYEAALKIDPESGLALNNLAFLLGETLGRPSEALPYAQKAKKIDPNNPDVLDTLGWVLSLNGRDGEALGVLLRAIELRRDYVASLMHLGMLHKRRNELAEARRRLEEAKSAAERQGQARYLSKIMQELESLGG